MFLAPVSRLPVRVLFAFSQIIEALSDESSIKTTSFK